MNLLDSEIFSVLVAVVTVLSIISGVLVLEPVMYRSYSTIGILNQSCYIGEYPSSVYNGDDLELCIYVSNHLGRVTLFQVRFKIVTEGYTLPSKDYPSNASTQREWLFLIDNEGNATKKITIDIDIGKMNTPSRKIALIFELWYMNTDGEWQYTGRWTQLFITVKNPVLG